MRGSKFKDNFGNEISEPWTVVILDRPNQLKNENGTCKNWSKQDKKALDNMADQAFSRWRSDTPYADKTAKEMCGLEVPELSKLLAAIAKLVKPGSLMFLLCLHNYQWSTANCKKIHPVYLSVVPNNKTRILYIYIQLPRSILQ